MMLATMPIRESRTAHGICEAMLQQYNHIPYDRWKHTVRAILMGESLREGSPIQYTKFKGEDLFGVRVNTNVWLSIHQDYVPRYRDVSQIKGTGSVPKVSSWETSSKKNRTALDDTIAGFDPLSAVIPPWMKRETVQSLICDIACMGDPDYRDTAIKALLRHPDNKGVIYAGDLWAIALHNGPIARFIFEILCELADKNKAWDEIVLETICCFHQQVKARIRDDVIEAGITIPPQMGVVDTNGFLFLLKYMNDKPAQWEKVINWLLRSHTTRFRKFFATSLKMLWFHNRHLGDVIQPIFKRLLRSESWQTSIITCHFNAIY